MIAEEITNKILEKVKNRPREWRVGQSIFNAFDELYPDYGTKIRCTNYDTFHKDIIEDDAKKEIENIICWLEGVVDNQIDIYDYIYDIKGNKPHFPDRMLHIVGADGKEYGFLFGSSRLKNNDFIEYLKSFIKDKL
jgi:hypothetical protein